MSEDLRGSVVRWRGSHYEVLGIGSSASAAQVREAYVRQLKRCHPDSAGPQGRANGLDVQRLITAYKTLKDETKRAAYDAQLNRGNEFALSQAPPAKRRKVRRYRFNPSARGYLLGSVLLLASLVFTYQSLGPSHSGLANAQSADSTSAEERDDVASPERLEPIAALAGRLSIVQAAAFSSRCFESARSARLLSAVDSCIAFDTAFIYWRQGVVSSDPSEAYFLPQAVKSRIEHAFPTLDSDAAMVRAASVRASTFEALLRVVDSKENLAPAISDQSGEDNADAAAVGGSQDEVNSLAP